MVEILSASNANVARARQVGVPLPGDVASLITRLANDLSVELPTAT